MSYQFGIYVVSIFYQLISSTIHKISQNLNKITDNFCHVLLTFTKFMYKWRQWVGWKRNKGITPKNRIYRIIWTQPMKLHASHVISTFNGISITWFSILTCKKKNDGFLLLFKNILIYSATQGCCLIINFWYIWSVMLLV